MEDIIIKRGREAHLLLYGPIDSESGPDTICARDVVRAIMELEHTCDTLIVHINSEGGVVYAGIAIFNALRATPLRVELHTDGIAASIAGIIAMCGRPHVMSRYGRLMIHSVSAEVFGDKQDMQEMIRELASLEDMLAEAVSRRCGRSTDDIKAEYFDGKEHWFSAEEAVRAGFADGIFEEDLFPAVAEAPTHEVFNRVMLQKKALTHKITNNMDIDKLKQFPRMVNAASEDDVLQSIEGMEAEIAALTEERDALRARLDALEQQAAEDEVDRAIRDGKVDQGQRATLVALLRTKPEEGRALIKSLNSRRSVKTDLGGDGSDGEGAWRRRMNEIRKRK
ncbi:MAG: ATP-dependent Clp protease proteolytic subunit [Bacteroidales bacterium]|nr:ATP-dependent Clp protease proteolytic subunit [Bacteroidales bacterium]